LTIILGPGYKECDIAVSWDLTLSVYHTLCIQDLK